MINITDSHIEEIERKFGFSFDDESKEFIKCLKTKDIQACPGAGKTTSLVAKLDIIAQHMPFKDNSGILVLTHTNVAVDEIKKKLGLNAKTLLSYPNHVGTFQSFVNKFLAIPMYIKLFGKKPERIDRDVFYKIFQERFDLCNDFHKNWLQKRADEKYVNVLTFIENFDISESEIKYKGRNVITTSSLMFNEIKTISQIPYKIVKNGYLTYSHCYELALKYLNDYENIKEIFQKRFKYVFVDEVQDTDDRQFEILDKLFSNSDVIIQRIGDKNQAIFSNMNSSSIGWKVNSDFLEIKNTKRLSKVISEKVTNFAISPQDLKGNEEITIFPTIILYDIENIGELVFKEFGNIIIENGLHNIENSKFKAVGAVGKIHEKGEITIPSYFPDFTKNDDDSVNYDSILEKIKLFDKNKFLAKDFRKILLDVVIEYLKLKDVKNEDKYFTKKTLFQFLENKEKNIYIDFKIKLFNSVKKLYKQECIDDEIKIKLEIILNLFGKRIDEISLKTIIKNYKINFSDKTTKNKFKYENADIEFEIDISTIHKIKGETHTATLVLETYKNKYDLEILLNLLKNKKRASFDDKKKLLYVAMSRPTHLLCFAMNKEHVNELDREELQNCGFIIKDI
jgi:DNA helicase II / ATP-dependent DNA helicase PcrA